MDDPIWGKNKRQWEEGARSMESFGWGVVRLLIYVCGWLFTYVQPVFFIYILPFLAVGASYIAHELAASWYQSLAPGTLSFSPVIQEHVLKAVGNSLGLGFLWLLVIASILGLIWAVARGLYEANWVTRVVSGYYIGSAGRVFYHWLRDVKTDDLFVTSFLICLAISTASEGVRRLWLWNKHRGQRARPESEQI